MRLVVSQGLVAAGETDTAVRALIYLATSQQEDGGFAQNFWINGDPLLDGDSVR